VHKVLEEPAHDGGEAALLDTSGPASKAPSGIYMPIMLPVMSYTPFLWLLRSASAAGFGDGIQC
jgi:hypothetical protein